MTTIPTLLDKYQRRAEKVAAQMTEIERKEAEIERRSPVSIPRIAVPDYIREVIHPILTMLAEALPEYPVHVPPVGSYCLEEGYYKIRVGLATLGGLSRPVGKDYRLYFTTLFKKRELEKIEIRTMEELIEQVKIELNKRGLLILPRD